MKDFCIYKNLEGKYLTLPEYLEKAGRKLGVERQRHSDDWLRNAKAMLEDEAI